MSAIEGVPEHKMYGVVVEQRVRITTGFAVEAITPEAAQARAVELAANVFPEEARSTGEKITVVSTTVLDEPELDAWINNWGP